MCVILTRPCVSRTYNSKLLHGAILCKSKPLSWVKYCQQPYKQTLHQNTNTNSNSNHMKSNSWQPTSENQRTETTLPTYFWHIELARVSASSSALQELLHESADVCMCLEALLMSTFWLGFFCSQPTSCLVVKRVWCLTCPQVWYNTTLADTFGSQLIPNLSAHMVIYIA